MFGIAHRADRPFLCIVAATACVGGCVEEEVPMPEGTTGDGANWSALYGPGIGVEEMEVMRPTASGVIVGGFSDGFADEDGDGWLVEIDPAGKILSQGTLGGDGEEMILDLAVLPDGDLVGTGWTKGAGAGGYDVWVFRLAPDRSVRWSYAYGGAGAEQGWSLAVTAAGEFVVAGGSTSFGSGDSDLWVLALDDSGMPRWQATYGGPEDDAGSGDFEEFTARVMEDAAGDLLVVTETLSYGAGDADVWVLKLDGDGTVLWQNAYGGADEDTVWSATILADGNLLAPAVTSSFSPDGSGDPWWLVVDGDGNPLVQRVLGLPGVYDEPITAVALDDGGGLLGVSAYPDNGAWQDLLVRVDPAGNPTWARRYEMGWSWTNALVAHDGGDVSVAGVYWGGDPQPDLMDLWVMRVDPAGGLSACDRIEDVALQTADAGATVTPTSASPMTTQVAPVEAPVTFEPTNDRPRYYCGP